MTDGATRGFLLHAGDACIGYAYVADGHVGPLAVTQRAAARLATEVATQQDGQGSPRSLPSPVAPETRERHGHAKQQAPLRRLLGALSGGLALGRQP